MSSVLPRKIPVGLAGLAIFLAGTSAGYWRYLETRTTILSDLIASTRRSAAAFSPAELQTLTGAAADTLTPAAASVEERLTRLRVAQPGARSIRILRPLGKSGGFVVLAAAQSTESKPAVPPGSAYPTLPYSAALRSLLASGRPATEGPIRDHSGTRLTGYAFFDAPAGGDSRDIIEFSVDAENWRKTLGRAALAAATYVWILLTLPLAMVVITRRELEQRDALRKLTEAVEQSHSAVLIVDRAGRVEFANAGFCHQIGYSRRELIGREWRNFQDEATPPDLVADLLATVRAGRPWAGEWMMRRHDGSVYPVRGAVTPVTDRSGSIRSYVAVCEDMTEIRRTEKILRDSMARAEAGERAKGQFLATMSHEIRTPLNGIVGFASLLLETDLTADQREFVEAMRGSSESLIQLTGDILDYARIESGGLKLDPQPCDPRECIESALDLVAAPAFKKGIELLHWVDESVPRAIVADVDRLRQVLVHLVQNAVKFTPHGEVEVRAKAIPASGSRPPVATVAPAVPCVIEFSIRDTGIGIAARDHDRLFRPFSQIDDSATRRFGGTGLGLALAKNLIEIMGGKISFASEPGHGSTFTFTVQAPAYPADAASALPLTHMKLAVAAFSDGLRSELAQLGTALGAEVIEMEPAKLSSTTGWNAAVVEVNAETAAEIGASGTAPEHLRGEHVIALVPATLPTELRSALGRQIRHVLTKPLHHEGLASLLRSLS